LNTFNVVSILRSTVSSFDLRNSFSEGVGRVDYEIEEVEKEVEEEEGVEDEEEEGVKEVDTTLIDNKCIVTEEDDKEGAEVSQEEMSAINTDNR
jgi:tRNA G10  N-methylase Trm11